jgi:hypothetical protein
MAEWVLLGGCLIMAVTGILAIETVSARTKWLSLLLVLCVATLIALFQVGAL